jgi:hypothetical protein
MSASLDELLSQNKLVTFRFLAQHAGVPVAEAKNALQKYADAHRGSAHLVFLLGGVRKTEKGDGPLEYKLVAEERLDVAKEFYAPLTACHPYSLHVAPAESGEALFLLNHSQDRSLYEKVRAPPRAPFAARAVRPLGPHAPTACADCRAPTAARRPSLPGAAGTRPQLPARQPLVRRPVP